MTNYLRIGAALAALSLVLPAAVRAQHSTMPAGTSHAEHMAQMKKQADMKKHGDKAMGFDQDKTTHHFKLAADGGSISVVAKDVSDQATRDQVRAHLKEIAGEFGRGDFQKPFLTHSETPPGVAVMQKLKDAITFKFEETEGGGIVRISTANPDALAAVHEFLTYQIKEHGAGA